jgi:tRNA-specific 2-thiouridylase
MHKKKVMLGMSGGVDSSVAVKILLDQGFEVIGGTMQVIPEDAPNPVQENVCCSLDAVLDAKRVADRFNIPHYVLNYRQLFKIHVIDYFVQEYLQGRTPNPCIACNRELKFGELLNQANSLGLDYVATGHYAQIQYDEASGRYLLLKGKDSNKDQSYVLYNLNQIQLAHTLLPLGNMTKPEVRELARTLNLQTANKPESQEICFIPDNDYRRFIAENSDQKIQPGNFVDTKGNVIGKHKGIPYYTIGQRKGLNLAMGYPVYVVDIIPEKNLVIVGTKEELACKRFVTVDNNFIAIEALKEPMEVQVKIRYKSQEVPGIIKPLGDGKVEVELLAPQNAITPGQAAVFYLDNSVVGGGMIEARID